MFDQIFFEDSIAKAQKLTKKFKFEQAAKLVNEMTNYLKKESAGTKEWGDIEDWSNRPDPVLWLNIDAKGSDVRSKIEKLKVELQCDCKPVSCKCDPTEEVQPNAKLKCKLCADPLINSGARWLPSMNFAICHQCKEILFDVFYMEQRASKKINQILEDAAWWTRGDRPQFTKALQLLTNAGEWCSDAATFSLAAK